ncbi:MAG: amidohydrolase family protein [Pyrinomonadaceae bacterium]
MKRIGAVLFVVLGTVLAGFGQAAAPEFDLIIRNGIVYDGSGGKPFKADIGIKRDVIIGIGKLNAKQAGNVVDAGGLAVSPGFINMLSWSTNSLIRDGRSLSELKQGVTTQIFGEGTSMGPVKDCRPGSDWCTLSEYLLFLEKKGVSQNVASYIGATTVRLNVIGNEDKQPTPEQMQQMREIVRDEMERGALGIGTSLIYPPAFFAKTEELIEMSKVAAKYKGKYISHMRSEGNQLIEAVDELLRIAREANIPAEIYHLKASGRDNWAKMDQVLAKVERARKDGHKITANMYTYIAGGTGLTATLPPRTQDGGNAALIKRLKDPETRKRIIQEMRKPTNEWENMLLLAGSPDKLLLISFGSDDFRPLIGKTLDEIAKMRGTDPQNTIIDLLIENNGNIGTIYFMMSEENVKKQLRYPWVSFGSDASSIAAEGNYLRSSPHPRAYGTFARLLGKYVREEKVISLQEAVRRLSGLPAGNLGLDRRGLLKKGYFADIVIFDPATIADKATFDKPHQYAVGVRDVFVNGVPMLKNGEHTGKFAGRALWGPGKVR